MFDYIPDCFKPKQEQHIDYYNVFRLVINTEVLTFEDFIPSCFEEGYVPKNEQGDYSVSLNKNREVLLKLREKFVGMKKYNGLAIGNTSNLRGLSFGKTHINYFLYDYLNNSPCDDFSIFEVF